MSEEEKKPSEATESAADIAERRRKHWTKSNLEQRRTFCLKKGLDPDVINSCKSEELVNFCLTLEGHLAGVLPLKSMETQEAKVAEPLTVEKLMLMMMTRDRERDEREEKRRADEETARKEEQKIRDEKDQKLREDMLALQQDRIKKELELQAAKNIKELEIKTAIEAKHAEMLAAQELKDAEIEAKKVEIQAAQELKNAEWLAQQENKRIEFLRAQELKEERLQKQLQKEREDKDLMLLKQLEMQERIHQSRMDNAAEERRLRVEKENQPDAKIKHFGELLKNVLYKMPSDNLITEIPIYFLEVESIFVKYSVPENIRVSLLNPYLSTAARKLVHTLPPDDVNTFDAFRTAVLKYFSLSSNRYKEFYWKASKQAGETYITYATRLESLLQLYMSSKNVTTITQLKDLFICDKVKSDLSTNLMQEVNKKEFEGNLSPYELGKFVDSLVSLEIDLKDKSFGIYKKEDGKTEKKKLAGTCYSCKSPFHYANDKACPKYKEKNASEVENKPDMGASSSASSSRASQGKETGNSRERPPCGYCGFVNHTFDLCRHRLNPKPCTSCSSLSHMARICPKLGRKVNNIQVFNMKRTGNKFQRSSTDSKWVVIQEDIIESKSLLEEEFPGEEELKIDDVKETPLFNTESHYLFEAEPDNVNFATFASPVHSNYKDEDLVDMIKLNEMYDVHMTDSLKIEAMQINTPFKGKRNVPLFETERVTIKIGDKVLSGICDSGSEITVINNKFISPHMLTSDYTIELKCAFGTTEEVPLVNIPCKLIDKDNNISNAVLLTVAVSKKIEGEVLLTPQDYELLKQDLDSKLVIEQVAYHTDSMLIADEKFMHLNDKSNINDIQAALETRLLDMHIRDCVENSIIETYSQHKGLPQLEAECPIHCPSEVENRSNVSLVSQSKEDVSLLDQLKNEEKNITKKILKINKKENKKQPSSNQAKPHTHKIRSDENKEADNNKLGADELAKKLHEEMIAAQGSDESLKQYLTMAKAGESEFFINEADKLLYRKASTAGFQIHQLVLPKEKRKEILELSHDSTYQGGHLAYKKTLDRVKTHFWWPKMAKEIKEYTGSCNHCQLSRRVTTYDRVPISAVLRPPAFADILSLDLIGPITPSSSRGHKYILSIVDHATRWSEAVCLKTATAKETCDALLPIFARIGLPHALVSDNGSNFVSELNKEVYKVLGIKLRTSSPFHPQGNGIVEKMNASLKKLLHIVTTSNKPREWDKKITYLLWSFRSAVHETLGVSPYQMVYGRLPRGPLSILKNAMTGQQVGHLPVKKSVQEYCADLRENIALTNQIADKTCAVKQKRYTDYYNRHAKDKTFNPGDPVIVLFPDHTNKLISKFQGPARIHTKVNDYTYLVEMPNGAVRKLHADKIRKYTQRIQSIGVIFDDEEDFGSIPSYTDLYENKTSDFETVDLSHLDLSQQEEFKRLLWRHKEVFKDKPGVCTVGAPHVINLEPGAKPKNKPMYRVPVKLQQEVDRQVEELLRDRLISPSSSPWSHPLVCVTKGDKTIRLCTNYIDVNSSTIPDRLPMPRIDDLINKISPAKFITTLDCTSGYWQIPVHPDSKDKTAFKTNKGLFQWNVLSFGLKNASATFQRTMNKILEPHQAYAESYIDDSSIYSNSWQEHVDHVDKVLTAFEKAGMTLRLKKCSFAKPSVKFVGHIIGSGKKTVDTEKIETIMKLPIPDTKSLWRSFNGMASYYRAYIPNLAQLIAPLNELTRKHQPNKIQPTESIVQSFEAIKKALCGAEVLRPPDFTKEFIIQCDASNYAIGACLAQINNEGEEHPIEFASSKLSATQQRWSTIEKEAYAIIFALRKFDHFVYGQPITIYTDHNPLHFLVNSLPKSSKLTRWSLALQRYEITIKHRAGKMNSNCDALSRL